MKADVDVVSQLHSGGDEVLNPQTQKIAEQERSLAELNRRVVEYDQRFDEIAAEVARVRVADVKQKHISPSDASSSGDSSLPSQSTVPYFLHQKPAADASQSR